MIAAVTTSPIQESKSRYRRWIGKELVGLYPTAEPSVGDNPQYEMRRVVVESVELDPHGRGYVVTGRCLDANARRSLLLNKLRKRYVQEHRPAVDPKPRCIVLLDGDHVREVADDDVMLTEGEAGVWLDRFNETMAGTPWRAAIVRT